jgi:hypothetical protein
MKDLTSFLGGAIIILAMMLALIALLGMGVVLIGLTF